GSIASATAAAYAKELLEYVPAAEVEETKRALQVLESVQQQINGVQKTTDATKAAADSIRSDLRTGNIKSWLCPPDSSINANHARKLQYLLRAHAERGEIVRANTLEVVDKEPPLCHGRGRVRRTLTVVFSYTTVWALFRESRRNRRDTLTYRHGTLWIRSFEEEKWRLRVLNHLVEIINHYQEMYEAKKQFEEDGFDVLGDDTPKLPECKNGKPQWPKKGKLR
ncbi:hypothetical protein QBC38DRAFT_448867, partial [Podospora fimiseda]